MPNEHGTDIRWAPCDAHILREMVISAKSSESKAFKPRMIVKGWGKNAPTSNNRR